MKFQKAGADYVELLKQHNARVKFFAAQALGRIKFESAVEPLLNMIAENNDADVYLSMPGGFWPLPESERRNHGRLAGNENRSLRIAAVLVLRRLQDERVQEFLNDEDEFIVTEAARAINDDWSIEAALPALANMLTSEKFVSEPLQRRAINAALRVGGDQELENLIAFAKRQDVPNVLRGEALAALGTWPNHRC